MGNYNKITLMGRVGQEPKYNESDSGVAVARLSVATSRKVNDKEVTQWHNVVCFKNSAKFVHNYVHKGDSILVEGEMTYPTYKKDGVEVKGAEVVATIIQMAESANKQKPTQNDMPAYGNNDDFPMF